MPSLGVSSLDSSRLRAASFFGDDRTGQSNRNAPSTALIFRTRSLTKARSRRIEIRNNAGFAYGADVGLLMQYGRRRIVEPTDARTEPRAGNQARSR